MKTSDGLKWQFDKDKSGGANSAGESGGEYTTQSGSDAKRALIKKETNVAKNIAEFLGAQIFQKLAPESSAKVSLARAENAPDTPSEKGEDVYVASEFIKGYKGDLYKDIFATIEKAVPKARPKLLGMLYKSPIAQAFERAKYKDFPKVTTTSLLIGDFDIHTGNIGWVENGKNKHLVRIDYAAAFEKFEPEIHPHSRSRHLPFLGPINHFRTYPEDQRVSKEFAAELDRVASTDLKTVVNKAFEDLSKYYGATALKEFGVHIGIDQRKFKDQGVDSIRNIIQTHISTTLAARQEDMSRFSAQIKSDLCVSKDGKFTLNRQEFKKVMVAHEKYFSEVLNGEQAFKFRSRDNKAHRHQINGFVNAELAAHFAMQTSNIDTAYELLSNGKKLSAVQQQYNDTEKKPSLLAMALDWQLGDKRSSNIQAALENGSNPNMVLPNGQKLIDRCTDFSTKVQLVKHGAHITKECLGNLNDKQIEELRHTRHEYKKEHLVGLEGKVGAVLDKITGSRAKHKEAAPKPSVVSQILAKKSEPQSFVSKVLDDKANAPTSNPLRDM